MPARTRPFVAASLLVLSLAACERVGDLAPVINKSGLSPADAAVTDTILVQKGDSAYIVARRYNVPLRDLIDANRLSPPYKLEAGQKLVLPSARSYVVQRGDTLYGISRMHNVDVSELTRLNNLTPPYAVQPGQTLRLPGPGPGAATSTIVASAPESAPPTVTTLSEAPTSAAAPAANAGRGARSSIQAAELAPPGGSPSSTTAPPLAAPAAPTEPSAPVSGGASTVTVSSAPIPLTKPGTTPASTPAVDAEPVFQPGQSPVTLRPTAHKPDASADAAAAVPTPSVPAAPTPPSLPSGRSSVADSASADVASVPIPGAKPDFGKAPVAPTPAGPTPATAPPTNAAPTPSVKPTDSGKGSETKTAEANPDAAPPPRGGTRFLWPVKGRLISNYGPKPDGLHNDGLNIAAAKGTPVVAADNGIVAYAGNELRGFGNLLLVKHADGWITAYAHLDRIEVERGATVKRGQTIGRVGQTGSVTSPQLHFELRKGSQAVDPSGQMDRKPPVSEGAFRDGPPGPG
ncbi:peptidoglycan DD-metalloendopeptidase family protein [Azospirillum griseum]|uniref:LysM peptidoglycan-binding domain-containing protein n=1 Tax=Azospirillum griseum TaxID=2496639 RepID=A0A3S0IG79_9PROT|nr:peptidoglycan DD-metalloendopeptidase family protein [Azospirillum griseum]RTR21551.1 LysM peptidoglycan-binding domain-containing protein [Azospirillum griseum]